MYTDALSFPCPDRSPIEFIPIYGTRCLQGKEAPRWPVDRALVLQSHLSVFLETTSVAVDEFQPLVLAFAAVLQAQMAYCGALPCLDTSDTLPADD